MLRQVLDAGISEERFMEMAHTVGRASAITAEALLQMFADVFLRPVVVNPSESVLADLPRLLERGYSSIKFFMPVAGFDANVGGYLEAVRRAAGDQCGRRGSRWTEFGSPRRDSPRRGAR